MSTSSQKYQTLQDEMATEVAANLWWSLFMIVFIAWILYGFLQYLSQRIGWSLSATEPIARKQLQPTPAWTVASHLGVTQLLKDLPRLYLKTGKDLWRGPFRGSQLLYQTTTFQPSKSDSHR